MEKKLQYIDYFSENKLEEIYHSQIKPKATVGIDKINRDVFENKLKQNISIINRKVLDGSYNFSLYKEKLMSKGRGKEPRVISIPTIRDKVALKALSELIFDKFKSQLNNEIVQTIINNIKGEVQKCEYNSFIKLDISNFYPSIDHEKLLKKIRRKIRKKEVISLLNSALITRTVPYPNADVKKPIVGVPQGLSISNILASVYLMDLDKKYYKMNNCSFHRYVDDIFVLLNNEDLISIKKELEKDFVKLKLELNDEKFQTGKIDSEFDFLGYKNSKDGFSVRNQSIEKLENSLIKIIAQFKYSNEQSIKLLEWSLNLRITGCLYRERKYGWLFFYSQVDDLKLLHHLDWFVEKMLTRFKVNKSKFRLKKFVRSYHEITKNLSHTNYIPNLSDLDFSDQRKILKEVFNQKNVDSLGDDQIDYRFSRIIFRTIRELEQDIQTFS